jgi:hypothetical protein
VNPIATAIHNVAEGREGRVAYPGLWRVYAENGLVYFENMAHGEPAVVVCTTAAKTEE